MAIPAVGCEVWQAKKVHLWKMMEHKNGKSLGPNVMAEFLQYPV